MTSLNLTWIVSSFLLTLSFFILIIWIVVNIAVKREDFRFKLRTMSMVSVATTILVVFFYAIDNTRTDMFIGYGLGIIGYMIIDHYYFTPILIRQLSRKMLLRLKEQNGTEQPESEISSNDPPDT